MVTLLGGFAEYNAFADVLHVSKHFALLTTFAKQLDLISFNFS